MAKGEAAKHDEHDLVGDAPQAARRRAACLKNSPIDSAASLARLEMRCFSSGVTETGILRVPALIPGTC